MVHRRGVYMKQWSVSRQLLVLAAVGAVSTVIGDNPFMIWGTVIFLSVVLVEKVMPVWNRTIQLRNGNRDDDREALYSILEEHGYAYETDVQEDRHFIIRFPAFNKSYVDVQEKRSFIEEDYSGWTMLNVRLRGNSTPVKEMLEEYIADRRKVRVGRSFTKSAVVYLTLGGAGFISGLVMLAVLMTG